MIQQPADARNGSHSLGELFQGFDDPRRHYTQVPDYVFDALLAELSGAQLKLLYYVIRHSFGYGRDSAAISWSRFLQGTVTRDGKRLDWGAGVGRDTLQKALPELVEQGLVLKQRQSSERRGDEASLYVLNVIPHEEGEPTPDLSDHRGFVRIPHSTPVPNQLFDVLLPHLTEGELKALSYITRRTLGMKEEWAAISYSQFARGLTTEAGRVLDQGTGLSERTAKRAIKGLEEKRCIVREGRDEADPSAPTRYRLRFLEDDTEHAGEGSRTGYGGVQYHNAGGDRTITPWRGQNHNTGGDRTITHETQLRNTVKDRHEKQQQPIPAADQHDASGVVVALIDRGVTRKTASELARRYPEYRIRNQIDMLPDRAANNPAAVLVKAIREDWAPPAGYETPEQRDSRTRRENEEWAGHEVVQKELRLHRETWRERKIVEHGIDETTLETWEAVQRLLPLYLGTRRPDHVFCKALMLPMSNGSATVLFPSYARKLQVGDSEREALEIALTTSLGRPMKAQLNWEE